MSEALVATDPAAAAEAARNALEPFRRAGNRPGLAIAALNLVQALLLRGDWDAADDVLTQAVDSDGLGDIELLACDQAWLTALHGDADTAAAALAGLVNMRASQDPQDQAVIALAEACIAAAYRQPGKALGQARRALAHAEALGLSSESIRWAWPLAARAAYELGDTAATEELLGQLGAHPPGHIPPILHAERELARARLSAARGEPAETGFAAAVAGLRQHSTPYHLAHGLLDHAEYLLRGDDGGEAPRAVAEARDIAGRLRCQPLLDRTDSLAVPAATDQAPAR
jgi:hypothetical protein